MGQRFQIYVRYNDRQCLFAHHLQWSYGGFSITRAKQLIKFIYQNTMDSYNFFTPENFDIMRESYNFRDVKALESLIRLNSDIGSYSLSCDLVEELYKWDKENCHKININGEEEIFFKMDPFIQDNNDGILVIDVQGDSKDDVIIKYAFDRLNGSNFNPITAKQYLYENKYEEYDNDSYFDDLKEDNEYAAITISNISFLENFKILSKEDMENIFSTEYSFSLNFKNYKKGEK